MLARKLPAVYMRGGANKALFLRATDLPSDPVQRDSLLLRLMGSPDPYARQLDGLGGGASASSNVVLVEEAGRIDCDVAYRLGQVALNEPRIDWSVSDGSLAAAVASYAIEQGMVQASDGYASVRIWQSNAGRQVLAQLEVRQGQVWEEGVFLEDGVPFPGAEVRLEFDDFGGRSVLPTGHEQDVVELEGQAIPVSMIQTDQITIYARAVELGLTGRERSDQLQRNLRLQERLEALRQACISVLPRNVRGRADASLVWVAPPANYRSSAGIDVSRHSVDVLARSMQTVAESGRFNTPHAIALATAAALPGSVVAQVARTLPGVATRIGHAAGVHSASASVSRAGKGWRLDKAMLSRSARCLMSGWVHVPDYTGAPSL